MAAECISPACALVEGSVWTRNYVARFSTSVLSSSCCLRAHVCAYVCVPCMRTAGPFTSCIRGRNMRSVPPCMLPCSPAGYCRLTVRHVQRNASGVSPAVGRVAFEVVRGPSTDGPCFWLGTASVLLPSHCDVYLLPSELQTHPEGASMSAVLASVLVGCCRFTVEIPDVDSSTGRRRQFARPESHRLQLRRNSSEERDSPGKGCNSPCLLFLAPLEATEQLRMELGRSEHGFHCDILKSGM